MVRQPSWSRHWVRDVMRRVLSISMRDLAIAGASFCGSAELLTAIRNDGSGATDRATDRAANRTAARALEREVAGGIAEIEDYLAGRARGPKPTPPQSGSRPRPSRQRRSGTD